MTCPSHGVLYIASIPIGYNRLRTVCPQEDCDYQLNTVHAQQLQNLGISVDFFAFFISALFALVAGFYVAVAFILFRRRSSGFHPRK